MKNKNKNFFVPYRCFTVCNSEKKKLVKQKEKKNLVGERKRLF